MIAPLPAVLDTPAADPLRVTLRQAVEKGQPLLLDGAAVERIGTACLQVLLAGREAAARGALPFAIVNPAPALVEMAALAGLDDLVTV